jgi:two-component system OmpR family sensor kinase
MKLRVRSLRTRLIALAVALVAFGVLATGVGTYLTLRSFLYGRLDDQVTGAALRPVRVCARPGVPTPQPGLAVAVLDSSGNVLTVPCPYGQIASTLAVGSTDEHHLLAGLMKPATIHPTTGGDMRAVAVEAASPDLPDAAYLIVALPNTDVTGTLGKLLALELIGGVAVVLAVAGLGAVGVRLGLRPLERVTRTAQEVAAELSPDGSGLDKRVEVMEPDTEVGQLAEAVNTMLDAVETEYAARYESEQRMRRFLADASHELRTPLTSLRGYAELIRLRGKEGTDPDARDALRRIEAEGTRMSRLVEDLLTLARHDRGAMPVWEPVPLTEVVTDAIAGVHAAHPQRTITMVDPGTPATVLGDHDLLLQVVRNVITNAAVHTPSGPITVTVSTPPGEVVVAVRDTGPGLPPEQAAHVFDRFWRADMGRTRVRGGSGLGLSIVQALAAQHGGGVTFETSPAAGSTVTIRLPAAPLGAPVVPAAVPHPAVSR